MTDTPKTPMQELWQQQPVEGTRMSLDEIRKRAAKFEKRILWRNAGEYVGGAIAMVLFVYGCFLPYAYTLLRIAYAVLIAGTGFVLFQLHHKGRSVTPPTARTGAQCAQFFRGELERQRTLLSQVWSWYLAPLVPGLVLFTVALAVVNPRPAKFAFLAGFDLLIAGIFILIWKLNLRTARSLQRQIDELSAAENDLC